MKNILLSLICLFAFAVLTSAAVQHEGSTGPGTSIVEDTGSGFDCPVVIAEYNLDVNSPIDYTFTQTAPAVMRSASLQDIERGKRLDWAGPKATDIKTVYRHDIKTLRKTLLLYRLNERGPAVFYT